MPNEKWRPSDRLMDEMKALALRVGATRVEVQVRDEVLAPDGKTPLIGHFSVLYLPYLGWTAKDDFKTQSWGSAYIVRNDVRLGQDEE
jgi:hypothetical protein